MNTTNPSQRLTQLLARLPPPDQILQGSLLSYRQVCSHNLNCRCHQGFPHGPYWYLSFRRQGKTRKVLIPEHKVPLVRKYVRQWKIYNRLIHQIIDANLDILKQEVPPE